MPSSLVRFLICIQISPSALFDPTFGDEIQQHDSRLEEGVNFQVFQPYKIFGNASLLTFGGNLHFNQINVGLYPTIDRNPNRKFLPQNINNPDVLFTDAQAYVNNYAGYVQNDIDLFEGHLASRNWFALGLFFV